MPRQDRRVDLVGRKLNYARYELNQLAKAETSTDLFATLDAFLSQARSVLYVLEYQYSWQELKKADKKRVGGEREKRQQFDKWFATAAQDVLHHPLTMERHEVVHRSGSPAFGHPIQTPGKFYYRRPDGTRVDGFSCCRQYLTLIEGVVEQAEEQPWL